MDLANIVELAKKIATDAHKGQYRRGGVVPYIEHPQTVVSRVGEDLDAQIVAWLHDVLEDCEISDEEILEKGIPERHVNAVRLLTKTKGVSRLSRLLRYKQPYPIIHLDRDLPGEAQ